MQKKKLALIEMGCLTLLLTFGNSFLCLSASAQNSQSNFQSVPNDPGVTMALYPVKLVDGKQYVMTPNGMMLPLPGVGINPEMGALPVYHDQSGAYWFVDKNNSTVRVTQQQIMYKLQGMVSKVGNNGDMAGRQMPPNAMMQSNNPAANGQNPPVVINNNNSPTNNSGSNGSSAGTSGLAAAGGAMAGAAIGAAIMDSSSGNTYYGTPYYHPMYHDAAAHSYWYQADDGKHVTVNQNTKTTSVTNQWDQQKSFNQANADAARQNANQNNNQARQNNNQARQNSSNGRRGFGGGGRRFR